MKKLIKGSLILVLMVFVAGCSTTTKDSKLTLGALKSIDALPLVIAQEKGYFKENGLDVNVELFTDASKRDAAVQAKELDGLVTDAITLSFYLNSGSDMKIVTKTTGDFSLVANKDSKITKVSDIQGKKVGIFENSLIEYLSDKQAKENGVTSYEKVVIPALPARVEALNSKQVDAAILPAPFDTLSKNNGHKVIKTISNDDEEITFVAFDNEVLKSDEEVLDKFTKSYNKAVDYLNEHKVSDYENLLIDIVGYTKESLKNIKLPKYSHVSLPDTKKVQEAFNWVINKGLIDDDIKATDAIASE